MTTPTLAARPNAQEAAYGAAHEEAQFRARMARAGSGPGGPARRRAPVARRGEGFHLGWKSWLALNALGVLVVVAAAVAWPPARACRHQGETVGFYAGDTVEACVRRGIGDRLWQADQRVKMLIRGSGR